jgi:hypothetical protein
MSTFIIYPLNDASVEVPYVLDCEDVDISLTFSVQDIQDVTKRRGSFSKTITLPGTSANNQAFGHAYNIQSFVGGFTPNKRIRCSLWNDGIQTFTGTLQLLSITKTNEQINYEVGIYSEEIAFFRQINETKLAQTVGVSGFNHTLDAALASGTWTATPGSGYVYGFIDGYGYSDTNPNIFSVVFKTLLVPFLQLTPSFYVKQLVDLIFAQSGYRYQSDFFNSANFKKLVIPYAGGAVLQNDLSSQNSNIKADNGLPASGTYWFEFESGLPGTYDLYAGIVPFDHAISDTSALWQLGAGDHYMTTAGWYTSWDVSYTLTLTSTYADVSYIYIAICDKNTGLPINQPDFSIEYITINNVQRKTWWSLILAAGETNTFSFQGSVRLEPNQEIDLRIFYGPLKSDEDKYFIELVGGDQGATISMICTENPEANLNANMVRALPPDITQADLLSDLQKMFNLYFYQSPTDRDLIYIEPFTSFYSSGSVDWTAKIDNTDKHVLQMGDPQARKQITFKYKDSGDAMGKLYSGTFPEGYGSRIYQTDNYYAKGEQVVETKCATVIPASFLNSTVIGRTFDIDSNNIPKAKANGYRIAQFNYVAIPNSVPWFYLVDITPTFLGFTSLPFIGHMDNPYAPTFDLAFGMPKNLYFKVFDGDKFKDYHNANLFNTFWRNYIIETTSKESLQIEVPVILDPVDIYQLDFRKPIYIEGILFRLLEVRDYNIGGANKCTAVLRRILNLAAPATGAVTVNTFFDSSTLVLGEMKPQIISPNFIE